MWTYSNPLPTGNTLAAVTWGGGRFVAVGEHGGIVHSPDGRTWTAAPRITPFHLRGIEWAGNQFVALGDSGVLLTSTDGSSWTSRETGVRQGLNDVAWTGSRWVAVGDAGTLLASVDGTEWRALTPRWSGDFRAILWTGTRLLVFGSVILDSPDGLTWSHAAGWGYPGFSEVAWSGTTFAGLGQDGFLYHAGEDLVWSKHSVSLLDPPDCIAWAGNEFLALGPRDFATSVDGETWESHVMELTSDYYHHFSGVVWSGSRAVAVGYIGTLVFSDDRRTWTISTQGHKDWFLSATYSGDRLIGVGTYVQGPLNQRRAMISESKDGLSWNSWRLGEADSGIFHALLWTGSRYVGVGDFDSSNGAVGGAIMTSQDGKVWQVSRAGYANRLRSLVAASGRLLGIAGDTAFLSTDGGETWSRHEFGNRPEEGMAAAAWAGDQFVAVGSGIATSPDGRQWTRRDPGIQVRLNALAWSGSLFVGVGGDGQILTSPDGIAWTSRAIPGRRPIFRSVIHTGRQFVAAAMARDGGAYVSSDGMSWSRHPWPTVNEPFALAWNGREIFAFGLLGQILASREDGESGLRDRAHGIHVPPVDVGAGWIRFGLPAGLPERRVRASVYSLRGEKRMEAPIKPVGNEGALSIQGLEPGRYVLEVTGHGKRYQWLFGLRK